MSWGWVVIFTKAHTWIATVGGMIAYVLLKRFCDRQDREHSQQRIEQETEAEQDNRKYRRRSRWRS